MRTSALHQAGVLVTMGVVLLSLAVRMARADSATIIDSTPLDSGADLQKVKVKCELTVKDRKNETSKDLTGKCTFTNTDNENGKRFLFCFMTDLKKGKRGEVANVNGDTFVVQQIKENQVEALRCKKSPGSLNSQSSYHFGCQIITLAKNGTFTLSFATANPYKPPNGVNPKASDFEVFYADTVNLANKPNKKFDDDKACNGIVGQNNSVDLDATTIDEDIRAIWALGTKDPEDPYVVFQPITPPFPPRLCDANGDGVIDLSDITAIFAARNTVAVPGDPRDVDHDGLITVNDARICSQMISKQYTLYGDPTCVPAGFPASVPDLAVCPQRKAPPPPLVSDLNLFFSGSEYAGTEFPVLLDVQTEGDTSGVRVETEPKAGSVFKILGGTDLIGELTLCSNANYSICLTPKIQEGRRLSVTVNVNSADTGATLFFERGTFIRDTEPPRVISHSAAFDSSNNLFVEVTAEDATTSPIHAELWFSTDAGATWDHVPLDPTSDILEETPTRTFQGSAGPFASGQPVRYFMAIQDVVSNVAYFGIGEVTP